MAENNDFSVLYRRLIAQLSPAPEWDREVKKNLQICLRADSARDGPARGKQA